MTGAKKQWRVDHVASSVSQVSQPSDTLKCESCDYFTFNKYYLKQHVSLVHSPERPFRCPYCDYAGKRSHSLKEHLIVHSSERPYECDQCNATFRKRGHLTNHTKMHSNPVNSFSECRLCHAIFEQRSDLYGHLRTVHCLSSFHCSLCDYATTIKSNLVMHENGHTADRSRIKIMAMKPKIPPGAQVILKCTACGYETSDKSTFELHMIEHAAAALQQQQPSVTGCAGPAGAQGVAPDDAGDETQSQRNKCGACDFATADAYAFIAHLLSHKPAMPGAGARSPGCNGSQRSLFTQHVFSSSFCCNICGYVCDSQRTIKAHVWKHSGHRQLEYPTFQNGPLSIYDGALVGCDSDSAARNVSPVAQGSLVAQHSSSSVAEDFVPLTRDGVGCLSSVTAAEQHVQSPARTPEATIDIGVSSNLAAVPTPEAQAGCLSISGPVERKPLAKPVECPEKAKPEPTPRAQQLPADMPNVQPESPKDLSTVQRSTVFDLIKGGAGVADNLPSASDDALAVNFVGIRDQESEEAAISEKEDSAVTLLSLLKKGPNFNPACPPGNYSPTFKLLPPPKRLKVDSEGEKMEGPLPSSSTDPRHCTSNGRQGICSSLLAVIEQLRESSDTEEACGNRSGSFSPLRKKKVKQSPDKGNVAAADTLDALPNVERLAGGGHRCRICHYSASSSAAGAALLVQHMKTHKNRQPFECSLCEFVALSSETLQAHVISHCKLRTYQCKQCPTAFNYKSQLRAHLRMHYHRTETPASSAGGSSVFGCPSCSYLAPSVNLLRCHLRVVHGCCEQATGGFRCSACGASFSVLEDVSAHLCTSGGTAAGHSDLSSCDSPCHSGAASPAVQQASCSGTMKCEQCDFVALSARSLKSHLKRHLNDRRYVEQPLEQYKCNMCGYVCHHLPSLKSHMWRHASDKKYSYLSANAAINAAIDHDASLRSIVITAESLQGDADSNDDSCVVQTDQSHKSMLVAFRCCQCGFETVDKATLNIHMREHSDIIRKTLSICVDTRK